MSDLFRVGCCLSSVILPTLVEGHDEGPFYLFTRPRSNTSELPIPFLKAKVRHTYSFDNLPKFVPSLYWIIVKNSLTKPTIYLLPNLPFYKYSHVYLSLSLITPITTPGRCLLPPRVPNMVTFTIHRFKSYINSPS